MGKRLSEINEEKSLMMATLKKSVEMLSNENNLMKEKLASMKDERSTIKEHDLQTANNFYQIFEENKERKFEMETQKARIKSLLHDVETYKYLSQQLKEQNTKITENFSDSLERIDKLVEDKEIISKKLRESNKLTMELLKERSSAPSKVMSDAESVSDEKKEDVTDWQGKYEKILLEKFDIQTLCDENEGTVNELTNQVIELEQRLQSLEMENELLRKEISAITTEHAKKSERLASAQRVALSIMQSNRKDGNAMMMDDVSNVNVEKDMFGLIQPPEPDLITSLLTYLLPFLFEEDDQPKIV